MKKRADVVGERSSTQSVHSVHSVVKNSSDHRVHRIHGMKRSVEVVGERGST